MSVRDFETYGSDLGKLIGRKSFLTLASSSLKLHIDEDKKGGRYLWIDPPWQFGKDGGIIETSATYPLDGGRDAFAHWVSRFSPIRESRFEEIDANPDGSLWLNFEEGYRIFVPKECMPDDEPYWYDHWYLNLHPPES